MEMIICFAMEFFVFFKYFQQPPQTKCDPLCEKEALFCPRIRLLFAERVTTLMVFSSNIFLVVARFFMGKIMAGIFYRF